MLLGILPRKVSSGSHLFVDGAKVPAVHVEEAKHCPNGNVVSLTAAYLLRR